MYKEKDHRGKPVEGLIPALNAIMETKNWIQSRIPGGTPIIIIIGERHDALEHHILQQALLAKIAKEKKDKVALGLELPQNLKSHMLGPLSLGKSVFYRLGMLLKSDTKGSLFLKMAKEISFGSLGVRKLFEFCQKSKIPVSLNGLTETVDSESNYYIDKTDEQTKRILAEGGFDIEEPISVKDQSGLNARNFGMVALMQEHIAAVGVDIYVQTTGMAHVMGVEHENARIATSYDGSIVDHFEKAGCVYLPVIIENLPLDETNIPEEAPMNKAIYVQGLNLEDYPDDSYETFIIYDGHNRNLGGILVNSI